MNRTNYYIATYMIEYMDAQLIDHTIAVDIGHDRLRVAPVSKAKKKQLRAIRKEWRQRND
tara:strand:+ start:368 stop:547 length:180 start_codon:yes stop_codon:yes gene_type:complete